MHMSEAKAVYVFIHHCNLTLCKGHLGPIIILEVSIIDVYTVPGTVTSERKIVD